MTDYNRQLQDSYDIRILSDQSLVENEETKRSLERLIEDASQVGCIEALRKNGHNYEYLTDLRRITYLDFLKINNSQDVLEIGSSMGQHTRVIAEKCRTLSAIEVVPLQAVFAKLWCNEDNHKNVDFTVGGASGVLPYADNSFDLVVCNYVLEWCSGRASVFPSRFHRKFLTEMFRVLRSNGRLFLSTKNRFSIRYVLGGEDEHLGVRFGSALPRPIQEFFRRRADLGHPTGYLHSWGELRNILTDIGFCPIEDILAFPDARFSDYVGTFEDFKGDLLSQEAIYRLGRKNKLSLRFGRRLFQETSNSIVFLATKGG